MEPKKHTDFYQKILEGIQLHFDCVHSLDDLIIEDLSGFSNKGFKVTFKITPPQSYYFRFFISSVAIPVSL